MNIGVRAHDFKVDNLPALAERMQAAGVRTLQLVCYKTLGDVPYAPGGITAERAQEIGTFFHQQGIEVALLGAYFNPVHEDYHKVERCMSVFHDYLAHGAALGCRVVGSETGSFNNDAWTYHPKNRTEEARQTVVRIFRSLCDVASQYGCAVALEGAAGHVCYNVATLAKAQQEISRSNLSIIFDLYNYLDADNCRSYLDILDEGLATFPDIHCFHIKDCVFGGGAPQQVAVGKGELDLAEIVRRIKVRHPDAALILEGTLTDDIPPAVALLRQLWER